MLHGKTPSIKQAVMGESCYIPGHAQWLLLLSVQCVATNGVTLHLATLKGLSRIGHWHEFPPTLMLHQCNDMTLLKYRQIKTKARRSYSPGTFHMNKQDKVWEGKHRKWFYLQHDHTSSKSNWASWTTYYLEPLSCCRMLPLQIGWQGTESSSENNRPGSSDTKKDK